MKEKLFATRKKLVTMIRSLKIQKWGKAFQFSRFEASKIVSNLEFFKIGQLSFDFWGDWGFLIAHYIGSCTRGYSKWWGNWILASSFESPAEVTSRFFILVKTCLKKLFARKFDGLSTKYKRIIISPRQIPYLREFLLEYEKYGMKIEFLKRKWPRYWLIQ